MAADLIHVSAILGPILGTAAAAIVAGDPRRVIWGRTPTATSDSSGASVGTSQVGNPA
jgi:hypothetical protein